MTAPPLNSDLLTPFHGYLLALAHAQLDPELKRQLDASDIVQQTLLRAHAALPGLQDRSPNVLEAWLRQILATEMADQIRRCHRSKRDIDREQSLSRPVSINRRQVWRTGWPPITRLPAWPPSEMNTCCTSRTHWRNFLRSNGKS